MARLDLGGRLVIPPENVKKVRELLHLDRTALGKMAGVDGRTVGRIERGQQVQELSLQAVLGVLRIQAEERLHSRHHRLMNGWLDYSHRSMEVDLSQTVQDLPEQDSIVRFGLSKNGKLALIPGPTDNNDNQTIAAYREEILDALQTLSERYSTNPNAPQVSLFKPLITRYEQTLSADLPNINFAILFALGTRLHSARRTAQHEVATGEWPEPEAAEAAAVDTVCDLHGPLMMASATGRRLVRDRDDFNATPEQQRREDELVQQFGEALAEAEDVFEPETRKAIEELSTTVADDPHPARGRMLRMAFVSSALIGVVGVVGSEASIWLRSIIGSSGWFGLEVLKQTDDFRHTRDALAKRYDQTTKSMDALLAKTVDLRTALKRIVDQKTILLEKIADLKPEFSWAKRILGSKKSVAVEVSIPINYSITTCKHILLVGDISYSRDFARGIAMELQMPFFDMVMETEALAASSLGRDSSYDDLVAQILADVRELPPLVIYVDRARHHTFRKVDFREMRTDFAYMVHFTGGKTISAYPIVSDATIQVRSIDMQKAVKRFGEEYKNKGEITVRDYQRRIFA